MDFEDLKKRSSEDYLGFLRGQLRFDIGKHKKTKLRTVLGRLGNATLLDNDVSKRHAIRLEKQFNARWSKLTKGEALERLRFWTVLDSLADADEASIQEHIDGMRQRLSLVCNKVRGIEVIGACEIEIVNFCKMNALADTADEARKLNTLTDLIPAEERTLFKKGMQSYALIHFHGIVDLKSSAEDTGELLLAESKKKWSEGYAVELKKLYSTFTMRKNFSNIAKYLVKGGNENLIYKIGYGYDTEDAIKRHMIKSGKAKADADFEDYENGLSLSVKEIEVLGRSIHALMNSSGSTMRNGYLFRHGYQKRW